MIDILQTVPPDAWAMLVLAMLAAGIVKGIHGLGLPLVAVPILSIAVPVQTAIAITLMPILITNLYQIRIGRDMLPVARRLLPMLVGLFGGILVGVYALTSLSDENVMVILSGVILIFVGLRVAKPGWRISPGMERRLALPVGILAGLIGGVSSLFGVPIAMFLSALGLDRDTFVRAVGLSFVTGLVPLYIGLATFEALGLREILLSILALGPVFVGYWAGQAVRHRISERAFHWGFTILLGVIALNLLRKGLFPV